MGELEQSDAAAAAEEAGLRYISDRRPGIRREKRGDEFIYLGPKGAPVADEKTLARIKPLAIPPAWTDVWISPIASGHLQATGRDAKGRKQYRYHPRWRAYRDATKYQRMIAFGESLPRIRERTLSDLGQRGLARERVLATAIRLLDETAIRIGNEEYARENQSYGLTTLEHQHVDVTGATLHLHFVGKAGKEHAVDVRDPRAARIVQKLEDLPGQELFQYLDDAGERHGIESSDVNAYLQEIGGAEFTAKDFRTWHGTLRAAQALRDLGPAETTTEIKRKLTEAVNHAAERLGNTPAICRKCYVNPVVVEAYQTGALIPAFCRPPRPTPGLEPDEAALLELLRRSEAPDEKAA